MKNKTITILLIIILSLIALILGIFMVKVINGSFSFTNFNFGHTVSQELVLDEIYDNDFKKIYIDSDASDIYVTETIDKQIRVTIYGDKDSTKVDTTSDNLTISSKNKPCVGFCFNNKIAKIEVSIPKEYENLININNRYGDISLGEFKYADIEIIEDSGDVEVKHANKITIDNKYGDILVNEANIANIKEAAGDVKVGTVNNITIKNNYGDIFIDNVYEYLDIDDDYGDIKLNNLEITKDSKIKNSYGDITVGKTNEIYIDAKTSLGDTLIGNNNPKSDIKLAINNSCGDIKINN